MVRLPADRDPSRAAVEGGEVDLQQLGVRLRRQLRPTYHTEIAVRVFELERMRSSPAARVGPDGEQLAQQRFKADRACLAIGGEVVEESEEGNIHHDQEHRCRRWSTVGVTLTSAVMPTPSKSFAI